MNSWASSSRKANEAGVPEDLPERITEMLVENPSRPWDEVIAEIAKEKFHESGSGE